MKKNISKYRKFLIERLGYARNKAKLSARELSGQLDKSDAYIAKFENGDFNMSSEKLLEAIEICGMTVEEFFFHDLNKYKEEKEFFDLYEKLSTDSKNTIKDLMKNLK